MNTVIHRNDRTGASATLTTESPASSNGVPVLRLRGYPTEEELVDMGPADQFGSGIAAGEFVVMCFLNDLPEDDPGEVPQFTDQDREAARQFLAQWPEGPQLLE